MSASQEVLQLDLYALLGVDDGAAPKKIKKAYRQKALTCHPDKNPDNPKAAELFHQLSQALEVLTDTAARAAYDQVRKAKKLAEERTRKLDDKRKKIKLDLEARERQAQAQNLEEEEIKVTRTLEEEIIRLREEGSKQLQEEQRLIKEQIQREREIGADRGHRPLGMQHGMKSDSNVTPKLKLKWKSKKDDETNGGYSHDFLLGLLHKYGDVLNVLVSTKKTGSAVVEFATVKAAELAFKNERGLTSNPLKISWLEGQPAPAPVTPSHLSDTSTQDGRGLWTSHMPQSQLTRSGGILLCQAVKRLITASEDEQIISSFLFYPFDLT
ncbi:dnaJ homolog subfamily C member 17-like isoform X2 [Polyodon spathula]|uniref:dnaJ homolog subfamily C member 17-like isoform X2 n=1 Tax=Polyodon spathula TaxID=7913 RepID=UPI001B7EF581|nr:dnaJ homolog subfamily C member 17-like isoform X2 [Polyodon spathula]